LSALAATGVLAAVAVPLLLGAYLLGRNKQRRSDEQLRSGYITDSLSQLDEILANVKGHKYGSGQEAIEQANAVLTAYTQNASALKDKKTRNIALKEIPDRINPKIAAITAAANRLDADRSRFNELGLPEFATGGIVPGVLGSPRLVLAHGGEVIANLSQQTPAFMNAASDAGIPGVRGAGSGGGNGGNLHVEVVLGTKMQNELFVNGASSPEGYKVLGKQSNTKSKFDDRTTSF
jgi:hypothetical protein